MEILLHLPFSAHLKCKQGETGAHKVISSPAHPAGNLLDK